MHTGLYIIIVLLIAGLALFFVPWQKTMLKGWITLVVSLLLLVVTFLMIFYAPDAWQIQIPSGYPLWLQGLSTFLVFNTVNPAGIMVLLPGIMLPLLALATLVTQKESPYDKNFHAWFLISAGLCFAILSAEHLFLLIFLWGIILIPLFMLVNGYDEGRASAGKKTMVILGGTHGLMATGAVIAVTLSGTGYMETMALDTSDTLNRVAFFALLSGALAATGVFPFQSWITTFAEFAPGRVTALIPIIIQRTAGAYLLIRLSHDLFILHESTRIVLLILGSLSALLAMVMSFAENHPGKKTALFHGITGGLILIVIATGIPAGLTAALVFVMVLGSGVTVMFMLLKDHPAQKISPASCENGEKETEIRTNKPARFLKVIQRIEKSGFTDIYHVISRLVFSINRPLSRLHDGVLQTYLVWVVAALIILFLLN